MVDGRSIALLLASVLFLALIVALGGSLGGGEDGGLWQEIAVPLVVLGGACGLITLLVVGMSLGRIRNRARRELARFQLVLSQADEAGSEEVAAAYEQLIQGVRQTLGERVTHGQPWVAIESWFKPAERTGETGTAALMLLCEPRSLPGVLGALRHAYPDLAVRAEPGSDDGRPLRFVQPAFEPAHVLRVRKARGWALPLGGTGGGPGSSNARSVMAGIVRQQQQAQLISCVRWCLLPAADQLDSRASEKLRRSGRREDMSAAESSDVQNALQSAGGAMCFLELQAAVEQRDNVDRRGRPRPASFNELQGVCRELLSPALSQRGANHLTERLMWARQPLYRRRFACGEPPLLPQPSGATLVAPRELALLMELPSLGSEHALPLQRNTVPNLPIPTGAPRARQVDLELPLDEGPDGEPLEPDEIVDAELVGDETTEP